MNVNRRTLLKYSALGCVASAWGNAPQKAFCAAAAESATVHPIVETSAGKVRGRFSDRINLFRGIPYGASTAQANRFLPPVKRSPWSGIYDALEFGPWAMQRVPPVDMLQLPETETSRIYQGLFPPLPWKASEDCLVLNVWSPGVADSHQRPVLVWLHGGGFSGGGGDWPWADGTHLARANDVVVVSLNHRLGIFGFLHLAEIAGPKYADAGNVGMLDIVAALEWVRDNITAFGGDPHNVTIMGESGGGCKVNVLLAMPAARGLFHKAINLSGPCPRMLTSEAATRTSLAVLSKLEIKRGDIEALQQVSSEKLLQAMYDVLEAADLVADGTWRNGTWLHMFDPVVDGRTLPAHPFDPVAPQVSAHVPLLIGTNNEDARIDAGLRPPLKFSLDGIDVAAMRANLMGLGLSAEEAEHLIGSYRARRPGISSVDVFSAIASDLQYRRDAIVMAERKADLHSAPVYMYLFDWNSPVSGGRYKSAHGFYLPFALDNLDKASGMRGDPADPRDFELARNMSRAFASFARTGRPHHRGVPDWEPYESRDRATMVFNHTSRLVHDPRGEDRKAVEALKAF